MATYEAIADTIRPHVNDDPGHVADLIVDAVSTATLPDLDHDDAAELFEHLAVMFGALAQTSRASREPLR